MPRILITGASKGLGQVAVKFFEQDGWEVFPFTRKEYDYLKTWNYALPDVEAIIHCAGGGLGLRGPYITAGQMYELFMTNLGGAMEINRMALPAMQQKGYGTIIHIGSIASGQATGSVGYATIKGALASYVRCLGRELAPYGVTICGLAPGGFTAPDNAMERLRATKPEVYADFIKTRLPRGKMGNAEDLMPLLKLLCSDQSGAYCGSMIPVDWGEGVWYSI